MSKTIPTALLTSLASGQVQPYYAVELLFDSSPIYMWTGTGTVSIEGNDYIGAGDLLGISGIKEVNDMSAQGITLTLNGVASSIVSVALSEPYQGRTCNVYFGALPTEENLIQESGAGYILTEAGDIIVTEGGYAQIFSGFMDKMTISDGPDSATIALSVESKMVDLNRARVFRYTDESQKSRYPSDTFFSFVAGLQTAPVVWGKGS